MSSKVAGKLKALIRSKRNSGAKIDLGNIMKGARLGLKKVEDHAEVIDVIHNTIEVTKKIKPTIKLRKHKEWKPLVGNLVMMNNNPAKIVKDLGDGRFMVRTHWGYNTLCILGDIEQPPKNIGKLWLDAKEQAHELNKKAHQRSPVPTIESLAKDPQALGRFMGERG